MRKVADTSIDPTLPRTTLDLNGKQYSLCFDFGALCEAEEHFRKEGHEVSLLVEFPEFTFANTRRVFPCTLRKFHPEISWDDAQKLINLDSVFTIANAIAAAWLAARAEARGDALPVNPTQP